MSVAKMNMFERRELTRTLNIPSKHLQRNIQSSLLSQLKGQIEGRCGIEGYVQPKSSVILEHSLGRVDMLHSGVQYRVRFHADICYPHVGQIFKAPVSFRSKIGIHAELAPVKILLPRDLHIGNAEFDSITDSDEIMFSVLGAEFKQNDESIFVLGRLIQKVGGTAPAPAEIEAPVERLVPNEAMPSSEIKTVAIKEAVATDDKPRRKRRLNPSAALQLNVGEATKGATES